MAPVGERGVPVDRAARRPAGGKRIGDDVGRGVEDPRAKRRARPLEDSRRAGGAALERAAGDRQEQLARGGDAHGDSSGTSSILRSFHERSASSASWIPLAPSSRSQAKGSSPATWRRNISHCSLKPLS